MAVAIPPTLSFAWIFHLSASCSFLLWPRSRAWPLLSPIVRRKQNGGCSAPVRAHPFSPLRGPLGPGPGAAPGGCARTVVPSLLPGPLTFPPAGAFVCCFGPAHARTCWSTHPLTSRASQRARRENLLLPLLDLPLCSSTSLAVGGCQVHTSSQSGKHVFFVLNTVLNRVPGIPFPRRVERMDSLSSQIPDL